MLKRKVLNHLIHWKNSTNKKPLIVYGARQIGKTYIIREFGKNNYNIFIEINFLEKPSYKDIFSGDLDIDTIIRNISFVVQQKIEKGKTLIFLDEIESCPNARTSLKFLCNNPYFDIICSGSLLGLNYSQVSSFPVGYVEYCKMYPLDFEEYLWANNIGADDISYLFDCYKNKTKVNEAINNKLLTLFKEFIIVGGMPEVVNTYLETKNYTIVKNIQKNIIIDYRNDIAKYADGNEKTKATACFDSIPIQLGRENKKFTYKLVEKNGRSNKYLGSINWLFDAGIVCPCYNLKDVSFPLKAQLDINSFKLYLLDSGLLLSMIDDININDFLINNNLKIYYGAVLENVIYTELNKTINDVYYFNKNNSLEIDFVISLNSKPILIEVKGSNNKAKSLSTYQKQKPNLSGIKLAYSNIGFKENTTTLPLYMVMFIGK